MLLLAYYFIIVLLKHRINASTLDPNPNYISLTFLGLSLIYIPSNAIILISQLLADNIYYQLPDPSGPPLCPANNNLNL